MHPSSRIMPSLSVPSLCNPLGESRDTLSAVNDIVLVQQIKKIDISTVCHADCATWCREWSGAHQAGETMCLPACSAHCALWVPREDATTCVTCSSSSVVQEQPYVSASFQSWCSLGACSRGNTLENSTLTPGRTCPGEAPNQNPTLISSHQQSGSRTSASGPVTCTL